MRFVEITANDQYTQPQRWEALINIIRQGSLGSREDLELCLLDIAPSNIYIISDDAWTALSNQFRN